MDKKSDNPDKRLRQGIKETDTESASDGTPTPSGTISFPTSREHTPGLLLKFQYDRETLVALREAVLSRTRPNCLSKNHDGDDNLWDPERWFRSFGASSRGASPITPVPGFREKERDKKRPAELDKESIYKRRTSDPKGRLKEEEEDGLGIVLSPQRRSFGTGCHVVASSLSLQHKTNSPSEERDRENRDRREVRRIGSGRIQISHPERHERDYRDGPRGRFEPSIEEHRQHRYDRPIDRFNRERDRDRRDYNDRRDYRSRYNRHESQEEEPEWFTGGPSSQSETIELHGFEDPTKEEQKPEIVNTNEMETNEISTSNEGNTGQVTIERESEERPRSRTGSLSVADRNGSLETNESSSPEASPHQSDQESHLSPLPSVSGQFDFNEFLKIDNIPGLSEVPQSGSRFSQWFQGPGPGPGSHGGSHDNSRRSSINEELASNFSFLYDLVNLTGGQKSPVIPSPPPRDSDMLLPQHHAHSNIYAGFLSGREIDQGPAQPVLENKNIIHLLQNASKMSADMPNTQSGPPTSTGTRAMEANLKALLMGGVGNMNLEVKQSSSPAVNQAKPPQLVPGGKVLTAAELEAMLCSDSKKSSTQPTCRETHSNELSVLGQRQVCQKGNKDISDCWGGKGLWASVPSNDAPAPESSTSLSKSVITNSQGALANVLPPIGEGRSNSVPHFLPNVVLPTASKMTTVSELEASFKDVGLSHKTGVDGQRSASQLQSTFHTETEKLTEMSLQSNPQILQTQTPMRNIGNADTLMFLQQQMQMQQKGQKTGTEGGNDMGAFNKLVGMMKASGALSDTPKMPNKPNGRPISPISLPNPPSAQKDAIANQQKDLIQKLLQQQQAKLHHHQQQQAMQEQILKFMKQNPGLLPKPPASPIPPQMASLQPPSSPRCPSPNISQQGLLQQPPGSPRAPSPIMFGKQPPMHLTAPSPIHANQLPQTSTALSPNTLQVTQGSNSRSPVMQRVPSPQELIAHTQAIMQNALIKKQLEDQKERFLRRQQDTTTRAKSPNPLVPGQQAKLCELMGTPSPSSSNTSTPLCTQTKLTPAFTPTSVIRKMANDRAEKANEDKSRSDSDYDFGMNQRRPPILKIVKTDSLDMEEMLEEMKEDDDHFEKSHASEGGPSHSFGSHSAVDTPPLMSVSADGSISIPVPMVGMATGHGRFKSDEPRMKIGGEDAIDAQNMLLQNFLQHQQQSSINDSGLHGGSPIKQPRALMGQGTMFSPPLQQGVISIANSNHGITPIEAQPLLPMGRAIVKGTAGSTAGVVSPPLGQPKVQAENLQRPIVCGSQAASHLHGGGIPIRAGAPPPSPNLPRSGQPPYGVVIPGRGIPVQPGLVRPGLGVQPNVMHMMHPAMSPPGRGTNLQQQQQQLNHIGQLAALQQQQQQQQQRASLDSRLQAPQTSAGPRPIYPSTANHALNSLVMAQGNQRMSYPGNTLTTAAAIQNAISRALSPQPQIPQPMIKDGPVSPMGRPNITSPNAMAALLASGKTDAAGLSRWFGSDMIRQQLPSMPPIPVQGQKAMTVDEIERHQQMVTN